MSRALCCERVNGCAVQLKNLAPVSKFVDIWRIFATACSAKAMQTITYQPPDPAGKVCGSAKNCRLMCLLVSIQSRQWQSTSWP